MVAAAAVLIVTALAAPGRDGFEDQSAGVSQSPPPELIQVTATIGFLPDRPAAAALALRDASLYGPLVYNGSRAWENPRGLARSPKINGFDRRQARGGGSRRRSGMLSEGPMGSIAFDTHAAATRFRQAGFTDDQVEALVEITRETTALPDISTLATKADIAETKADIARLALTIKADIAQLEARMESRFGQIESRFGQIDSKIANTQVQTIAIVVSANAVVVGLITLLSRLIH
jgi:hypothetical protein